MNSPQLTWSFPLDADFATVLGTIVAHHGFAAHINERNNLEIVHSVPEHIKRAVESVGAQLIGQDNPANGVETSAAMSFAHLVNGGVSETGNVAPLSAAAETSTTAHAVSPATSQTSPVVSSAPAPLPAVGAGAQTAFTAESPIHANTVDKDGVPHDARIHSDPPSMTEKGVWRKKRGISPADHKRITAELAAAQAIKTASAPATPQPTGAPFDKAAAVAQAHAEAIKTCGAQPISDTVLNDLLAGKQQTLSPSESNWYYAYFARRNEVYLALKANAQVAEPTPNVTSVPVVDTAAVAAPVSPISAPASALDATGLPHDPRLHLTPPLKDPQGVYIQRMDVSSENKLAIMAELRGNGAGQASGSPGSAVSSVPAVPLVTAAEAATSFPLFMRWAVQNTNGATAKVTIVQVNEVVKNFGIVDPQTGNGSLAALNNDAYVPYYAHIIAALQGMGAV